MLPHCIPSSRRTFVLAVLTAGACVLPANAAAQGVVRVRDVAQLRQALTSPKPGTRVLLAPGTYAGGLHLTGLQGQEGRAIVIAAADPDDPPVVSGGGTAMHLVQPAYVELRDLVVTGARSNGVNIDDGGTFGTPAHHVVLKRLTVRDIGPEGNRDGIKLSGVDHFRVEGCTIERWGSGGSGIDMVGCHEGLIEECTFRHGDRAGGSGVQAKGGSRGVVVRRCRFEHSGHRAVNVGGSTGLQYFRPNVLGYEAKDITVEGCTFVGSQAPIAFVGVDGATVCFNTIYRPAAWVFRILQETRAEGFVPSRDGVFRDNLIVFRADELRTHVNIGSGTAPETFRFARNAWYCEDSPARSKPSLPSAEAGGIYGKDPLLRDPASGDLGVNPGSPAESLGAHAFRPDASAE